MARTRSDGREISGQQGDYIPSGDAREERYRLSTFAHFPVSSPMSKISLARSGFYFTGFKDRVKCFACGKTVEGWEGGEDPSDMRWHRQVCPLQRGLECGNIPSGSSFRWSSAMHNRNQRDQVLETRDPVTGNLVRRMPLPSDLPERVRQQGGTFQISPGGHAHIQNLPVPSRPKSAEERERCLCRSPSDGRISDDVRDPPGQSSVYIPPGNVYAESYRLYTFTSFPVSSPVDIYVLAEAGFYFTGYYDRVKCFACGIAVERWEACDNPSDMIWHKQRCPLQRGLECGNIPLRSRSPLSSATHNRSQHDQDLETRDPIPGSFARRKTYPSDLPERVRQQGGVFQILPGGHAHIQNPPPRHNPSPSNTSSPGQWRMADVISADHRRLLSNLYLNRELDRLASFARWPAGHPNVSPTSLARNGFFYLGDMDRTQCFSCGGVLRNWTSNDDAFAEHRSHFPQCKMVLGTETRNVSVPSRPESTEERERCFPCRFPSNPHMRSDAARLDTFYCRWPIRKTLATAAEIAQAGFFYLGELDRVKCWYCNGGLQNWDYDDDPWVEHSKWFPSCEFLLRVKGQHFVHRHLSPSAHLPRPIISRHDGASIDPPSSGQGQASISARPASPRDNQPAAMPTIIDQKAEHRSHFPQFEKVLGAACNVPVPSQSDSAEERERCFPCRNPSNPCMRSEAARLNTFDHHWPINRTSATPAEIAQAGFFYLGERDCVKCWYCNGGLQNWDYNDDPWVLHAKRFPTCQFLLRAKGRHFALHHLSASGHLQRSIILKQNRVSTDPPYFGPEQASTSAMPQDVQSSQEAASDPRESRNDMISIRDVMMNFRVVPFVLEMGFEGRIVEAVFQDKVLRGHATDYDDIYIAVGEFLDELIKKEEELGLDQSVGNFCSREYGDEEPQPMEVDESYLCNTTENQTPGESLAPTDNTQSLVEIETLRVKIYSK